MLTFDELKTIESSLTLIEGKPGDIHGISHSDAPLDDTFVFIRSKKFLNNIGRRSDRSDFKKSGLVIENSVLNLLEEDSSVKSKFAWIASIDNVSRAMCTLTKPFYDELYQDLNYQVDGRQMGEVEIDPTAQISQSAFVGCGVKIGANVKIMPGVVLMPNVSIDDDTIIFPNVTIYPYCKIGKKCRIHAGTVIGCDGFGYNLIDGEHKKIWHLYGVIIEDEVEIGCNTMIDNGAFIETKIGYRSRIDNDVQVSHNVLIGKNVVVCGKTGLAGSVEVGDYCAFGAQAGAAPGAILGEGVQVAAKSAVSENAVVPPGSVMAGYPARPVKEWLKAQAVVRKLIKK